MAACSLSICVQKKDVNLCSKEGCQFVFKRRSFLSVAGQGGIDVFKFCSPKLRSSGCRLRRTTACSLCSKEWGFCSWQVEPPKSVLTSMPVPSTESIHFHPLTPSSNLPARAGRENSKFPVSDLPYKFQLDDISTNFARVSLRRSSCALFSCIYNSLLSAFCCCCYSFLSVSLSLSVGWSVHLSLSPSLSLSFRL